ncbi:PilZ domain-containing protein [Pseudobacteriovorax antillogorgiicola]|uniref:PilZ domain-containing protein n=1 Tax=Pseudobacteriovorax antillogorgiicola TaxID=1513793 RepID=A0A1Y6CCV3_9BACT|nr:PilZ domain-containing protein [Pseudobacteriovorax antillogorgiicola]TCS48327.1 PilZ domain-containing protein [Pseudobacteriovorax antillogorgiicola]SMF56522.1 PilZ domain-containing protein [Pseudobacteriovorax antillogorgiicola]
MDCGSLDELMQQSIRVSRSPRFDVRDLDVRILARANGMRYNCFWLKVLNISSSGLLITNDHHGFVTFRIGDTLQTTMDIAGRVFRRPIHVRFRIVREHQHNSGTAWGLEVVEVEERHSEVFQAGIDLISLMTHPKVQSSQSNIA